MVTEFYPENLFEEEQVIGEILRKPVTTTFETEAGVIFSTQNSEKSREKLRWNYTNIFLIICLTFLIIILTYLKMLLTKFYYAIFHDFKMQLTLLKTTFL